MITKHKSCRECNRRMLSIGLAKDDARRALRKHAKLPTQASRERVQVAQEKMRDAIRLFEQHMSEGVPA